MIESTFKPSNSNKIAEHIHATSIEGLFYLPHKKFEDERGFYSEISRVPEIENLTDEKFIIKQINQSRSITNVARGIHSESWNKLITVSTGLCFCVLVDLRPDSPTFSKFESFYLGTDELALNGSLFVKKGIGNSLCVLKGPVDYLYAVDQLWQDRDVNGDRAISLFDPDINIAWPINQNQMILSQRDKETASLRESFPKKF